MNVLGLNSGTSADGVDLAVVACAGPDKRRSHRFLEGKVVPYPAILSNLVHTLTDADRVSLDDVIACDSLLGQFFGQTAGRYLVSLGRRKIMVDAIASHGQTVRHMPIARLYDRYRVKGTLQLGSLDQIAALTGKTVVGDFRQADVALGNEGAPITVAAMGRLFSDRGESRLIVNIGGMSNYFYLPKTGDSRQILAADCGPGNSLCDLLAQRLFHVPFDRGGKLASKGVASARLLNQLLTLPFFAGREQSTGREQFGVELVTTMIASRKRLKLTNADLMATGAELTAAAISTAVRPLIQRDRSLRKLYLTGGGVRNNYVRRRLANYLPELTIDTVRALGFDPDLVEASAYAVMGSACLRSEPTRTLFRPGRTQTRYPISGSIVQPPQRMTP